MKPLLQRTMGALAGQFVLGMTLNVLGEPEDITNSSVRTFYYIILVLHILNALWLIVSAVLVRRAAPQNMKGLASGAIASLGVALIAGSLTTSAEPRELWSFVMAMGFLATFQFYGRMVAVSVDRGASQ